MNSGRAALLHGWKPTATTTATALQVICASIYPQHKDGLHICCGSTRHRCGLAIHLRILLSNKRSQGIIPLLASDVLQWRSSMRNINLQDLVAKPRITCSTTKEADTIHSIFFQLVSEPNITRVCPVRGISPQLGKMHFGLHRLVPRGHCMTRCKPAWGRCDAAIEGNTLSFLHPPQVTETRTGPLGCNSYDNLDSVSSVLLQSTESKLHLQGRAEERGRW